MKTQLAILAAAALCAAACKQSAPAPGSAPPPPRTPTAAEMLKGTHGGVGGLGTQKVQGFALDLRTTIDGRVATFLLEAEKPKVDGIPPQMRLGELHALDTKSGERFKLGNGVTNTPGGYTFSPDGRWALFLAGYNLAEQSGELWAKDLQNPKAARERLGGQVTFYKASPDSKLVAFVDGGSLKVGPLPQGPFRDVAGEVQTLDFSPDSKTVFFKRRLQLSGGLYAVPLAESQAAPIKVGDQVGDWGFSPDGRVLAYTVRADGGRGTYDLMVADAKSLKGKKVAESTCTFVFSPDSAWLAHTRECRPGERAGDLYLGPADGSASRKVGDQVADVQFSPDSKALAFLELFDLSARAMGVVPSGVPAVLTLPDGKPRRIGKKAPHYAWSPDSKHLAFLEFVMKPVFSPDLYLHRLEAPAEEAPLPIAQGVFSYAFTQDSSRLLFRAQCIREGRACDLSVIEVAKPKEAPKKLIEQIYSFKVSEDSKRVLAMYARAQGDSYDVMVHNLVSGERKTLELQTSIPALFLEKDGSRVAYIVNERARAGVYLCDQVP